MKRFLPTLLVLISTFGIVHGDLMRPCACGPDNPASCGLCPSSLRMKAPGEAAAQASPERGCCCCKEQAQGDASVDSQAGAPEEGRDSEKRKDCSICPGPRAPRDVPGASVALETAYQVALCDAVELVPASIVLQRVRQERLILPLHPPWKISPEGLAVFLV